MEAVMLAKRYFCAGTFCLAVGFASSAAAQSAEP
jgi:hypothetical protein